MSFFGRLAHRGSEPLNYLPLVGKKIYMYVVGSFCNIQYLSTFECLFESLSSLTPSPSLHPHPHPSISTHPSLPPSLLQSTHWHVVWAPQWAKDVAGVLRGHKAWWPALCQARGTAQVHLWLRSLPSDMQALVGPPSSVMQLVSVLINCAHMNKFHSKPSVGSPADSLQEGDQVRIPENENWGAKVAKERK